MTEQQQTADPRRIEWLPLDQLIADPANPKDHAHDLIDDSIRRHGVIDLITRDDRTGYIVSGHGRTTTLRAQRDRGEPPPEGVQVTTDGTWLIPVATGWSSTDDLDARAALIGLNRTSEAGGWVDDSLLTLLDQLSAADALAGVGYTEEEIEALRARLADSPKKLSDPDSIPDLLLDHPTSEEGDLWILGPHRLVVGDSTNGEVYQMLLDGDDGPTTVFTDPPYGIAYAAMRRGTRAIANDDSYAHALATTSAAFQLCAPSTAWFVCCDWRSLRMVQDALDVAGVEPKACIVWDKQRRVQNLDRYAKQYELVVYAGPYGGEPTVASDVWSHPRDYEPDHPTPKPVSLIAQALTTSTQRGDLILDPFAGSGSTLIAAHETNRTARLIEIDPIYADVICRRYQEHTGVVPVRDGVPVDFTA